MSNGRIGGGPGRLITKVNTAGQSLSNVTFSTVNSGTTAWTEIVNPTSADTLITGVGFYATAGPVSPPGAAASIDIGRGAAGAEVLLDTVIAFAALPNSTVFPGWWVNLAIPQRVSISSRIAVRLTQVTNWGSTYGVNVYIATVPLSAVENS